MSDLAADQLRWARMIKRASEKQEAPVEEIIELEYEVADLGAPLMVDVDPIAPDKPTTGLGACVMCKKHRQLWAGVCAWCGADDEDLEHE